MRVLPIHEIPRLNPEEYHQSEKLQVLLILDNIRSAANVGSCFRSADAFAIEGIALVGISAKPPHREILRTALGATETVAWQSWENVPAEVQKLKNKGYQVLAVEIAEGATTLPNFRASPNQPLALILGNEVSGVGEELMKLVDGAIEIPQYGTKHSFNVSVAAGIVLWEISRQIR
ncbi:MAG: TrmH family RNA methyltransferase [Bacteroidota bacterium]